MQYQKNLFNLIKSLNPAEKGYFRKYAKRHTIGDKNIYLRLFDEIDRIKNIELYNESSIKDKIGKYSSPVNFSVLKGYLYQMILKSMRGYNEGGDIDSLLDSYIADYKFLLKKNLPKECGTVLQKAKRTAYKYERLEKLYEIVRRERLLIKKLEPANVESLEKVNLELIEISRKIRYNSEYIYLNDVTISYCNKFGFGNTALLKNKLEEVLKHRLLKDKKYAITFYSKLYYYQIHSLYHFILSEYEKALSYFIKILKLYEQNPEMIKDNIRNYILILQNCLDMYENLKWYDNYHIYYDKIVKIKNDKAYSIPVNLDSYILSRTCIYELRKFTDRGDFNPGKKEIKEILNKVEENLNVISPADRIILMFQFVMFYFGCGNYNESIKWLNKIMNKEEDLRRDLRTECKLLFLIIHYELENYELLEYAVKSTYRYLRKAESLIGLEPLILEFIKKFGAVSNHKELVELLIELKFKMLQNKEVLKQYGFNYLAWVESKITGRTFAEVMKENFEKEKAVR